MVAKASLSLRPEVQGQTLIVYCAGRMTLEYSDKVKAEIRHYIPGKKRIILDLREVERMDSSGLGALIGLYISAKKENCEFELANYGDSIRELLGLTHLLGVFEAHGRSGTRLP
jgi:anti-anti-sigma factor